MLPRLPKNCLYTSGLAEGQVGLVRGTGSVWGHLELLVVELNLGNMGAQRPSLSIRSERPFSFQRRRKNNNLPRA